MNSESGIEDFVTFEQAKKLKELGFNYKCNHYYHLYDEQDTLSTLSDYENSNKFDKIWSASTLSQAQKWLREVKKEHIIVCIDRWVTTTPYRFEIYQEVGENIIYQYVQNDFQTYEEALSAGISKALELIENETD